MIHMIAILRRQHGEGEEKRGNYDARYRFMGSS